MFLIYGWTLELKNLKDDKRLISDDGGKLSLVLVSKKKLFSFFFLFFLDS